MEHEFSLVKGFVRFSWHPISLQRRIKTFGLPFVIMKTFWILHGAWVSSASSQHSPDASQPVVYYLHDEVALLEELAQNYGDSAKRWDELRIDVEEATLRDIECSEFSMFTAEEVQDLQNEDGDVSMECYEATVPRDYQDSADSHELTVSVFKLSINSGQEEPLVVPGDEPLSNWGLQFYYERSKAFKRDILVWFYRRPEDDSIHARCIESTLYECLKDLNDEERKIMGLFATVDNIWDLEAILKALKINKFSFYASAYGSVVANGYMQLYPEKVSSAILHRASWPLFYALTTSSMPIDYLSYRMAEDHLQMKDPIFMNPRVYIDKARERLRQDQNKDALPLHSFRSARRWHAICKNVLNQEYRETRECQLLYFHIAAAVLNEKRFEEGLLDGIDYGGTDFFPRNIVIDCFDGGNFAAKGVRAKIQKDYEEFYFEKGVFAHNSYCSGFDVTNFPEKRLNSLPDHEVPTFILSGTYNFNEPTAVGVVLQKVLQHSYIMLLPYQDRYFFPHENRCTLNAMTAFLNEPVNFATPSCTNFQVTYGVTRI